MTTLTTQKTVFIRFAEEIWNKPYPMKRSDVYDYRSVVLKCKVVDIKGEEFKATLLENNGFEKDGETFVFHKNQLLSNQDFTDFAQLGVWSK